MHFAYVHFPYLIHIYDNRGNLVHHDCSSSRNLPDNKELRKFIRDVPDLMRFKKYKMTISHKNRFHQIKIVRVVKVRIHPYGIELSRVSESDVSDGEDADVEDAA